MKKMFLLSTGFILIASLAIYPRPFKQAKLGYLKPLNISSTDLEYTTTGLWYGCQLYVYNLNNRNNANDIPTLIGPLPSEYEVKFSPWLKSLSQVFIETAYFYTLNFDECLFPLDTKYSGYNLTSLLDRQDGNTLFRVGETDKFMPPISHANTILIFTVINNRSKLIIIKGGA